MGSDMGEWLRIAANIASILTTVIAATASILFWANKRSRRSRLERYLRDKKQTSPDEAFSVPRLMADLGMTEAEIFAASFASRHVVRGIRRDRTTGFAAEVLFQYRDAKATSQPDMYEYPEGIRAIDGNNVRPARE
jgi:aromatic ring hydroxylase